VSLFTEKAQITNALEGVISNPLWSREGIRAHRPLVRVTLL